MPEEDQDSPAPCPDPCPDGMFDAATDDQRGHSNRGEGTATDTPEAGEREPGVQTEGRPRTVTHAQGEHGSSPATDPGRGAGG